MSDNPVYINIVGTPTQVELCRVRVLVVLDEILVSWKKKDIWDISPREKKIRLLLNQKKTHAVLRNCTPLQKSFKAEVVRLPLKLQYLICGRKRAGLLPIIEETSTNIYFPSPFTDAVEASSANPVETDQDETQPAIYITGEPNHVSRVKDMLNKLAVQKVSTYIHQI